MKKSKQHSPYLRHPIFLLRRYFKWIYTNFKLIHNMLWTIFNPSLKVFLKLINYPYKTYWALFTYNTEKYYITKSTQLLYPNAAFLHSPYYLFNEQHSASNLVEIKKLSSSFELLVNSWAPIVGEYERNNRYFLNKNFFINLDEEEPLHPSNFVDVEETNVWTENMFKYNTKLLITQHRLMLMKFFKFRLKRQYRITKWISNLLKWKTKSIINSFDCLLTQTLFLSKLVLNQSQVTWFIQNGLVYVNGYQCRKPTFFLKKGDLIQLIFSPTYINFYVYYYSNMFKSSHKFFNKFSKKLLEDPDWELDQITERTGRPSKMVLKLAFFKKPIPINLEVDFLTLSCFVLYLPLDNTYIFNKNYYTYNYYLNRFYNWKFRS